MGMGMGEVSEWNASVSCLCTVCGPFSQVNLLTLSLSLSLCVIRRVISAKSGERDRAENPDQRLTSTLMSAARAQI